MDNNLKNTDSSVFKIYLENMREYCNKYDNIAILNQVKAFVGAENIALSDVYADFALVSKDEYDRGNGKKTFSTIPSPLDINLMNEDTKENSSYSSEEGLNVDDLIRKIDRKIYMLEVEEVLEKDECLAKKQYLYICVIKAENDYVECRIKKNSDDLEASIRKIIVKNDTGYFDKIQNRWVWVRGYKVKETDKNYYFLEPHWYKEEKTLTKEELGFIKSDKIIEDEITDNDSGNSVIQDLIIDNNYSPIDSDKDVTTNGMVVLSEPGGGKTTYLKHLVFQLLSNESEIFEKNGLDKNESYIPFFVRTRDITDILDNAAFQGGVIFNEIIKASMCSILGKTDESIVSTVERFFNYLFQKELDDRKLLIIDGFEELNDFQSQILLDGLDIAYETNIINRVKDKLIISSRYKEYGYQKLVNYCQKNGIEEKYIIFDNKNNAIDSCVSKWFEILKRNGQDNHAYFNKMRTSNKDIGRLITTPLELTGLIMLCQSQSALPTDITVLYRSMIEIWLTYGIQEASLPFFSLSDIFLELSAIAYYMAESENEKLRISKDKIAEIIKARRSDLRRYYRSNAYVDASSDYEINALIEFWFRRNIFVKNSNNDIYEFAHREYQSFLISYAIVNNFIPKSKRKDNRIQYFEDHMDKADDFWDRVIVFSAFMSTDIHDAIIECIFKKLDVVDDQKVPSDFQDVKNIDKYYLSIILQLTNAEGFYFDDSEYKKLFDRIFRNFDRISIMKKSIKGSEIKKLLSNGRKINNTAFLKKCIEVIETWNKDIENAREKDDINLFQKLENEKSQIIEIVGNMVFHVAWNCDAELLAIKRSFQLYLDNWITMDIIYEIKDSLTSYHYNDERIAAIKSVCLEAITREKMPLSDCYMILATILAYKKEYGENNTYPYRVAIQYFEKAKKTSDEVEKNHFLLAAINIVFLSVWFLQSNVAEKYDCSLKDTAGIWKEDVLKDFLKCATIICEYMETVNNNHIYCRDLLVTYRDLCQLKYPGIKEEMKSFLYDRNIFNNCILLSKEDSITKKTDEKELAYVFEIITEYPLQAEYLDLTNTKDVLFQRITDIEKCRKANNITVEKEICLLKLLVIAGKYNRNEKLAAEELEQELNHIRQTTPFIKNRWILDEIEQYIRHNLCNEEDMLFNNYTYSDLMEYIEKRISEL